MDEELGLASALEGLRDELEEAWQRGRDRAVRFQASEVTLTLTTVTRLDKDGSGKIRWYVLEAGGGVRTGTEQTHTLTLTLKPMHADAQGKLVPLAVSAAQEEPGR